MRHPVETAVAVAAALVALAFALSTFERWLARRRRHELAWSARPAAVRRGRRGAGGRRPGRAGPGRCSGCSTCSGPSSTCPSWPSAPSICWPGRRAGDRAAAGGRPVRRLRGRGGGDGAVHPAAARRQAGPGLPGLRAAAPGPGRGRLGRRRDRDLRRRGVERLAGAALGPGAGPAGLVQRPDRARHARPRRQRHPQLGLRGHDRLRRHLAGRDRGDLRRLPRRHGRRRRGPAPRHPAGRAVVAGQWRQLARSGPAEQLPAQAVGQ